MNRIKITACFMLIASTLFLSGCTLFGGKNNNNYNCTVSVMANPANYGSVEGGGTYKAYQEVTIKAVPKPGHHFVEWSDGVTVNPLTFVISENVSYTAIFERGEFGYEGNHRVITYDGTVVTDSNCLSISAFDPDTFCYWYVEGHEDWIKSYESSFLYYVSGGASTTDIVLKASRRLEGYGVYVVKNLNHKDYLVNPAYDSREKTKENLNSNYNSYIVDKCEITANSTGWSSKNDTTNTYYFNQTLNYSTETSYFIIYKFFKYENDETVKAYPLKAFLIDSPQKEVEALRLPLNDKTYVLNVNFNYVA